MRSLKRTSLIARLVKNPPANWETRVGFLGREDPLEEGMGTHSSFLAWRIQEHIWGGFGHLMQRSDSLEKTLILGKIEGRRRRGRQRMSCLDGITDLMDMFLLSRSVLSDSF